MLEFRNVEPKDKAWMTPILSADGGMGSEYAFGTQYIWQLAYHTTVGRYKDFILRRSGDGKDKIYGFPVGRGDLKEVITVLMQDAEQIGSSFRIWGVTEEKKILLETAMPGEFTYEADRNVADYIYRSEDLINLAGRKYHSKRNHLAQFGRTYSWTYEDLGDSNMQDCIALAKEWCIASGGCGSDNGLDKEACALKKTFEHYKELAFSGGLIRIDGKAVAFTIGEEINSKAFVLHFEKALAGYNGLYAAINNEFAKRHLSGYEYINREEDLGIEGLRKAKLSYNPEILLEKYIAFRKG